MFFLNERISRGILTNSKAGIAQLVERNLAKVEVASSNLFQGIENNDFYIFTHKGYEEHINILLMSILLPLIKQNINKEINDESKGTIFNLNWNSCYRFGFNLCTQSHLECK